MSIGKFTNPIGNGCEPWETFYDGFYYLVESEAQNKISIKKSTKLQEIVNSTRINVWTAPEDTHYSKETWAPELHFIDGRWYIYFAADDGKNENHRMFVIEGSNDNPISTYHLKGQLTSNQSIDGTVLQMDNGDKYFIWSGAPKEVNPQYLYISKMASPWSLTGETIEISRPEYDWEKSAAWVNEGPTILKNNGKIYLIFSASACFGEYCYGQLTLEGDNPLDKGSWVKKSQPVFVGNETVWGPGHGNFTQSPDGTESWMIYHAKKVNGFTFERHICIQKYSFNEDGSPNFGKAIPLNSEITEPSY